MFDGVAVVKSQWEYIDEKLFGVVERVAGYRAHYAICEKQIGEILIVTLEIYEMVRQCPRATCSSPLAHFPLALGSPPTAPCRCANASLSKPSTSM